MSKVGDISEQIMSWIELNYYQGMEAELTAAGFTCESQKEVPWYVTDCPRSKAMALHNKVLADLISGLKQDKKLGRVVSGGIVLVLSQKYFSDKEMASQAAKEKDTVGPSRP
jgi:hypothetical protein